jgi:GNAT superfamily N-acetyltransferase
VAPPDGRPLADPGDGAPGAPEHAAARRPQTRPAGVVAYQSGEIHIGHREAIADIVRATGVFSALEIAVALELFDTTYGPPLGPADAAGEGSGYEFLGLFDTAGALLGYACFGPTPGTDRGYDLYWIAITPEAQGAGAGTFLIGEVERRLRERNARLVLAETSSRTAYQATRAFYVARGYTESARVRAFYGPEDDRMLFTKRLQPAPRVRGSRGGEVR